MLVYSSQTATGYYEHDAGDSSLLNTSVAKLRRDEEKNVKTKITVREARQIVKQTKNQMLVPDTELRQIKISTGVNTVFDYFEKGEPRDRYLRMLKAFLQF
jgi:hypothetical protein